MGEILPFPETRDFDLWEVEVVRETVSVHVVRVPAHNEEFALRIAERAFPGAAVRAVRLERDEWERRSYA
jgi:hypothetical protein